MVGLRLAGLHDVPSGDIRGVGIDQVGTVELRLSIDDQHEVPALVGIDQVGTVGLRLVEIAAHVDPHTHSLCWN